MKKILLVTDVYGWGGHVRAEYIKKYLSDEFHFDIVDGLDFEKLYKKNRVMGYDLIYLLFHTQLLRKDVRDMLSKGDRRFMTIVTAYPTLRAEWRYPALKKQFTVIASRCRALLANNYISIEDIKKIHKGKVDYAPRGVDENIFYPTRQFKEKSPNDFTVAFVGKPIEEKGLETIIRPACKAAQVKLLDNTRIYTDALSQDQMREFYNQADAYVVASTMDGTPNPALEAAACGLPLVANRIGNMPELIDDHRNSWLVDREVQRYIHRFMWMKNHQRVSWEFGQKIREKILREWTWEKVLNSNERMIFRRVLA